MQDFLIFLPLFLALGAFAGLLAGMLGIGGGVVLVPGIYYFLDLLGYETGHNMHIAVGTSLAVIAPTGFMSARSHWQRGAVRFDLVREVGAGVVIGAGLGSLIAHEMSSESLKAVFACALVFLALIMISNPARFEAFQIKAGRISNALAGGAVGTLSTLMGIGGATISVPYMSLCGVQIREAVGTAAALGLLIAIPATLGFVVIGCMAENLPPFSIGYFNVPAWLAIVPASVLCAPLGAKVAHALPVNLLRKIFAAFMALVAVRMLYGVFHGS